MISNLFTKSFYRFAFGFVGILALSFGFLLVTTYLADQSTSETADDTPSVASPSLEE